MTSINELQTAQKKVDHYKKMKEDIFLKIKNKTITDKTSLVYEYYVGRYRFWLRRLFVLEGITKINPIDINAILRENG